MAIRDQACVDFAHVTHDFGALLSAATLDREAALIDMRRAAPWPLTPDKGDTVWMGAIDAARPRGLVHPVGLSGNTARAACCRAPAC